jgi:hypothetical protein
VRRLAKQKIFPLLNAGFDGPDGRTIDGNKEGKGEGERERERGGVVFGALVIYQRSQQSKKGRKEPHHNPKIRNFKKTRGFVGSQSTT